MSIMTTPNTDIVRQFTDAYNALFSPRETDGWLFPSPQDDLIHEGRCALERLKTFGRDDLSLDELIAATGDDATEEGVKLALFNLSVQMNTLASRQEHQATLDATGFWGKTGAGCLMMAETTKRILVPLRGPDVLQPGTWGTWGGAVDINEGPLQAVIREVKEEGGVDVSLHDIHLLSIYQGPHGFRYYNYLVTVPDEFEPHLDHETTEARWCTFPDFPTPLHFGLEALLRNQTAMAVIEKVIAGHHKEEEVK